MSWTISVNGTEKTLAEWKAKGLNFSFRSQLADEASFTIDGKTAFDEAQTFQYDDVLTFKKDGAQWFVGRVAQDPRTCNGPELKSYLCAGPWQDLEEIIYRQYWTNNGSGVPTGVVFLCGQKPINQVITEVLTWAISCGANLQIGTIEPSVYLPQYQDQDKTCAEVIRDMLHICPDAVSNFDYSTTPPTFHLRRRSSLPAVSVSLPGEFSAGQILERYDLQIPCVHIDFRRTQNIDGSSKITWTSQNWPIAANPLQRGTLAHTFDLEGMRKTTISTEIVSEAINPLAKEFWQASYPFLADPLQCDVASIIPPTAFTLKDKAGNDYLLADYPYELLEGTIPAWMTTEQGYSTKKLKLTARVKWTEKGADGTSLNQVDRELTVDIPLTDAPSGTYKTTTSMMVGELEPTDLAKYLYLSHEQLQYQGQISTQEKECSGELRPGKALNLLTASNRYASMAALIQEVSEPVDNGTTSIRFGPHTALGADELIEYFRSVRWRRLWENPNIQTDTEDDNSDLDLSVVNSGRAVTDGGDRYGRVVASKSGGTAVMQGNASGGTVTVTQAGALTSAQMAPGKVIAVHPTGGSVNLDASLCRGKILQPMTLDVCVGGVNKQLLVAGAWL